MHYGMERQVMSDFNKWCGDRDTDRLAELGTDAWREAMKLMRSAWDHQDAINDTLRDENERLKVENAATAEGGARELLTLVVLLTSLDTQ
jgi:Mg2+ and Co2+ transporter CorA